MSGPISVWLKDPTYDMLRFFSYRHLTKGPMQDASRAVHDLAVKMYNDIQPSAEKTAGMRKLLEAKDCLVRAAMTND